MAERDAASPAGPVALAIDPGRAKCGVAVLSGGLGVLHRSIVETSALADHLASVLPRFLPTVILVGSGTGSADVRDVVASLSAGTPVELADEAHTSEAARARYIAETQPRGLERLLPRSLRSPNSPYDDYVAVILAERWLARFGASRGGG